MTNSTVSDQPSTLAARRPAGSTARKSSRAKARPAAKPLFPLESILWPARSSVSRWVTVSAILMVAGLFRWGVSLWSYSGEATPPTFGDFEAQRHWMEITINLPITQWYFYKPDWWRLDYPPLTAYHSWILGQIGTLFNPEFFALEASEGYESHSLKIFMRASVLASEFALYIPAICIFSQRLATIQGKRPNDISAMAALAAVLMVPTLILTDHGHFQYNSIMLGLFVETINSLLEDEIIWACIWFVSALAFKQMALFYAPAIFFYLLGSTVYPEARPGRFLLICLATLFSFALYLAPLVAGAIISHQKGHALPTDATGSPTPPLLQAITKLVRLESGSLPYAILLQLTQVLNRIFPLQRGLFEDKVANIWCFVHTFHKLHRYPQSLLQLASMALTAVLVSPACAILFRYPSWNLLVFGTAASAWGFFLASYQVHEKSVLLPLIPTTLVMITHGLSARIRGWVGFVNVLAAWTMYPLLAREGLQIPYFVILLLWCWLIGVPPVDWSLYTTGDRKPDGPLLHWTEKVLHVGFYIAMVGWHIGEATVAPPSHLPDTWFVLNILLGAVGFGVVWVWCVVNLLQDSGLLAKVLPKREEGEKKTQ